VDLLNPPRLDKKAVKRAFNRNASGYDQCAALQAEVQRRLLDRLDYLRVSPEMILDLGCGTGQAIAALNRRYRSAKVIGLDLAEAMLKEARKHYRMLERKRLVNGDFELLPFIENSFDMVFSSLALQWSNDLRGTFTELKRVGKPEGVVMFTTLGTNSLRELRYSWASVDKSPRVHQFLDMHDIGDAMLSAGLLQPVVDMEEIVLTYHEFGDLMRDIKGIGASNADKSRSRGLMTPSKLNRLRDAYKEQAFDEVSGCYRATYEVVYGHAWFA
jgi:malonyl-CoA O-methyltransferase